MLGALRPVKEILESESQSAAGPPSGVPQESSHSHTAITPSCSSSGSCNSSSRAGNSSRGRGKSKGGLDRWVEPSSSRDRLALTLSSYANVTMFVNKVSPC